MVKKIKVGGFWSTIFSQLARAAGVMIIAFTIGTAASAGACLYYGVPIALSLLGGLVVLGIALALMWQSSLF